MCTVSWLMRDGGYELFFNRDELRTRQAAVPPRAERKNGVRYLAPTDPDAGGTWLAVNELGVTVGVLNGKHTEASDRGRTFESRGRMLRDLADSSSAREVLARIADVELERHRPFHLFAIEPIGGANDEAIGVVASARWNGAHVELDSQLGAECALYSSSRDPARAARERSMVLERMRIEHGAFDAALLNAFHRSHEPERGPFSVCMHREDACTVSFSRVRVDRARVELRYYPAAPCEPAEEFVSAISRVQS